MVFQHWAFHDFSKMIKMLQLLSVSLSILFNLNVCIKVDLLYHVSISLYKIKKLLKDKEIEI